MSLPVRLLLQELGVRSLAHYARYQLELRTGVIRRRTPTYRWEDRPLAWWTLPEGKADRRPAQFPLDRSLEALDRLGRIQQESELPAGRVANEILEGRFRLFGGEPVQLGLPPDWLRVPFDEAAGPVVADRHWSRTRIDAQLDLRLLWEPSRFGWAYPLGRTFLLSGDLRYADQFLLLISTWRQVNPPNHGPNWISAQECALRILALSFAGFAFAGPLTEAGGPDGTPGRELLLTTVAALANRIPPTLAYARAQRNNHLITEAVGLYTAGTLYPQFRQAPRWKSTGRRLLVDALADQVFPDGGYIQHSANYHRLALSAGLWAARLAEANGEPLPQDSLEALRRLTDGLAALVDPVSGRTPNLGSNDGSDILPLAGCAHTDCRPLLQAASLAFTGRPALPPGPWDETALWLGLGDGEERRRAAKPGPPGTAGAPAGGRRAAAAGPPQTAAPRADRGDLPQAGLYFVRGERSWAMLRCATFRSRPSQSDQLHLDLWWKGCNIARDPGSYRYSVPGLEGAAAHNTLTADDREPMRRLGRFLWVPRHPARYLARWSAQDRTVESIAAEQRLPGQLTHRRSLVRSADTLWVVLDELYGSGEHEARLSWLLPDGDWELEAGELRLRSGAGDLALHIEPAQVRLALYRAGVQVAGDPAPEPESVVGWWAPRYGRRLPALCLVARLRGPLPLRLASWWRLGDLEAPADLTGEVLEQVLAGDE